MTLTFNPDTYTALLAKYRPKVIATEEENEQTIALAQELDHRLDRTLEEDLLLELLVTLIKKFEDEHYSFPERTPCSVLLHLMEANNIKQEDLVSVIGTREVISEIINDRQSISKAQATALAKFFNVDTELFVSG